MLFTVNNGHKRDEIKSAKITTAYYTSIPLEINGFFVV